MAKQNPDFPVPNMPRMGRRNAIIPSEHGLPDDTGAFSPLYLIQRASTTDTYGQTTQPRANHQGHFQNQLGKFQQGNLHPQAKNETIAQPPVQQTSYPEDSPESWKRIADAVTKVEALLDPKEAAKFKKRLGVLSASAENRQREQSGKTNYGALDDTHKVIPWKNQDVNLTTIGEERRKIFESFNKTSIEPPETPEVSESKLRRMMSKVKRKRKKQNSRQSDSEESLDLPRSTNKAKTNSAYANVQPKVNTRWNKYDEFNRWKAEEELKVQKKVPKTTPASAETGGSESDKQNKRASKASSRTKATVVKKPGPLIKPNKGMNKKETTTTLLKPKELSIASGTQNAGAPKVAKKLVTNYPAAETVKDVTVKLPLTIGPRYNARKAIGMGMTSGAQNKAELVGDTTTRLYGTQPPYQKLKIDTQQQQQILHQQILQGVGAGGTSYKSTFFNLHRINNGGTPNNKHVEDVIGQLIVVRHPNQGGVGGVISVETKKAPQLTTIQAPSSPFMASNISIPSQLNEIPVNGEIRAPAVVPNKSSPANTNKTEKSGKKAAAKRNINAGNKITGAAPVVNNKPQSQPQPNSQPPPRLTNARPGKNAPVNNKKAPVQAPAGTQNNAGGKVPPTVGTVPNKYNNIYIGPYSGSESEGESSGKKR